MMKVNKILSVLTVILMLVCIGTNVFATVNMNNIKSDEPLGNADATMEKMGSTILSFVTNAAMILAVVLIAVLGVKYMMGSTEEKAEYKKSLIPYVVGAVFVFGAGAIGKMIVNFAGSIA